MSPYEIHEVDGVLNRDAIERFNSLDQKTFPLLKPHHLSDGYWWLVYHPSGIVAFAGMVPMEPFPNVGYLKRCLVLPGHHGHGLQYRLMAARELKAKQLGWTMLVSECRADNSFSAGNFRKAGFERCDPEQKWAGPDDLYWCKVL